MLPAVLPGNALASDDLTAASTALGFTVTPRSRAQARNSASCASDSSARARNVTQSCVPGSGYDVFSDEPGDVHRGLKIGDRDVLAVDDGGDAGGHVAPRPAAAAASGQKSGAEQAGAQSQSAAVRRISRSSSAAPSSLSPCWSSLPA